MTREEFMDLVYDELHSDGDNYRANRIIDAADEYAEPCEDAISRQAAIDEICTAWKIDDLDNLTEAMLVDMIKALPPVSPSRPKGEWIDYPDEGFVECPFCHSATNCDGNIGELHYCFSCGAEMRGEQE